MSMDYASWNPVYEQILSAFGFDRGADETARDRLAALTQPVGVDLAQFTAQTVAIAGASPDLETDNELLDRADAIIAASDAGYRLADRGYSIEMVVTDLDGRPEKTVSLAAEGTQIAVHAHGDNIGAIEQWVPELPAEQLVPTTQAQPVAHVRNFGGFTDGDRAAFLADALGAAEFVFPGWSFEDPSVSELKRRKLRWAARLLYWLEHRRTEQFAVLDPVRDAITLPPGADH